MRSATPVTAPSRSQDHFDHDWADANGGNQDHGIVRTELETIQDFLCVTLEFFERQHGAQVVRAQVLRIGGEGLMTSA